MVAPAPGADLAAHVETMRRMKGSGDYLADHFEEVPLLLFVFAIDDLGGANIYPAIWSALLAARAEGVGGVMTMVLCNFTDEVNDLLGVPVEQGWKMSAMLTLGYPRGLWGVAANGIRCKRFRLGTAGVRHSASRCHSRCGRLTTARRPTWPRRDESPQKLGAEVRPEDLLHRRPVPLGGISVIRLVVRHGITVPGGIRFDRVLDARRGEGLLELFGVVGGERSVVLGSAHIDHRLDLVGPQCGLSLPSVTSPPPWNDVAAATRFGTRPATVNAARPPMQ